MQIVRYCASKASPGDLPRGAFCIPSSGGWRSATSHMQSIRTLLGHSARYPSQRDAMRFSFTVPSWFVPRKLFSALAQRSRLTGKASVSRDWLHGGVGVTVSVIRVDREGVAYLPSKRVVLKARPH